MSNFPWDDYRLIPGGTIDIVKILEDHYALNDHCSTTQEKIKSYVNDIQELQPTVSRQAAAIIIINTLHLPYWAY